jgi:flagellar protein FlaF
MPALAAAVHDNRRLWTILAADVADPANPLPAALRARLVYLAEFTRVHSGKVLREGASPDPLIEINIAVMRGLSGAEDAS